MRALSESEAQAGPDDVLLDEARTGGILRRSIVRGLIALLVIASLSLAATKAWGKLPEIAWHFDVGWIILAVAGFTVLNLSHALLWRHLLLRLGEPLPLRRGLAIWCTSGLARYTPGTVLYSVLRVTMANAAGVTRRTGLAAVVYELAFMLTSTVIVGAYGLTRGDPLSVGPARWALLLVPIVALVSMHPRIFRPVADAALRRAGKLSLSSTLPSARLIEFVLLYCATWVVAGLSIYALLNGLIAAHVDDFLVVLAAPAGGFVAAALGFMIPGGIGARETGLAAVLSLAVPLAAAVAVAIAVRLVQLAVELCCAGGASVAAGRS